MEYCFLVWQQNKSHGKTIQEKRFSREEKNGYNNEIKYL